MTLLVICAVLYVVLLAFGIGFLKGASTRATPVPAPPQSRQRARLDATTLAS